MLGVITTGGQLFSTAFNMEAGFVMHFMGPSLPFLFAGGLKAMYDLALYFNFRNVKPPEEQVE
jgi:hypothetical protein